MGQSENNININHRENNSAPQLDASLEATINAQKTVQKLTGELELLQSNVLNSLQEDVKRLVEEKRQLTDDVQKLSVQKNNLQSSQIEQQQQVLIRQLVQVLANHVSIQLQSSLEQLFESAIVRVSKNNAIQPYTEKEITANPDSDVDDLIASLKAAVTSTFEELQSELKNYQSSFSVQLSRMYSEQEQGEAILAELVYRLRNELDAAPQNLDNRVEEFASVEFEEALENPETAEFYTLNNIDINAPSSQSETQGADEPPRNQFPNTVIPNPVTRTQVEASLEPVENTEFVESQPQESVERVKLLRPQESSLPETPVVETIVPTPIPTPSIRRRRVEARRPQTPPEVEVNSRELPTSLRAGFILIMLSVVASALYNVSVKAMFFQKSQIFGVFDVQQLIVPTLGNCFLILMLRMLVVVPLMLVMAPIMHQGIWNDIRGLVDSLRNNKGSAPNATPMPRAITKQVLVLSLISGFFLFLSQVLIYLAIGQVATGVAISLFFIYPVISGFFGWLIFRNDRERPTLSRVSAIACICFGQLLVLGSNTENPNISFGSTAAIVSGVTFAIYIVLTRICAARLHPVSFTLLNFTTMLLLCFVALIIPLPANIGVQVNNTNFLELILSAFILGVLTLAGYVLNNLGIRKFGAIRSALIGACVPALTVLFAGLIIQENLELIQVIGVLVVTVGAAAFNLEKIRNRSRSSRTTA
ncbi:MAG: EamA family transporter [Calothrix sp. FI2-JRJ7]|jgi:drug/metabolite transporter (DMT)-like permease|nr:EamA family transporter [Calothrix sp. FI2-JRJ7]